MQIEYKLVRSKRKTVAITLDKNGEVLVKAGLKTSEKFIEDFLNKNIGWIEKQKARVLNIKQNYKPLDAQEIKELKKSAKQILAEKTKAYGQIMGVFPTGVKITSAATRWGSCSPKNSICYSYRVMLLPEECQNYIVLHELSHIRIKNHSSKFYQELGKYLPNYKQLQKQIKNFNGYDLQ